MRRPWRRRTFTVVCDCGFTTQRDWPVTLGAKADLGPDTPFNLEWCPSCRPGYVRPHLSFPIKLTLRGSHAQH